MDSNPVLFTITLFVTSGAINLQGWLQNLLTEIRNILQILIMISFNVGLAAYILPEWGGQISAFGKNTMYKAVYVQVLFSLANFIFAWLGTIGT